MFSLSLTWLLLLFLVLSISPLRCHFYILIIILLILLIICLQGIYLTSLQNILVILKLLLICLLTWYTFISVDSLIIFSCFAWTYFSVVSRVVFYLSLPIVRKNFIGLLILLNVNTLLQLIALWIYLDWINLDLLLVIYFFVFILFHLALAELISPLHAYALFHLNHTLLWNFLRLEIVALIILILRKVCHTLSAN